MMSLYAPNATMTVGPGATASGMDEIRRSGWRRRRPSRRRTNWVSDHPAYKLEITVNGDRGTLHFECHYVDVDTEQGRVDHGRGLRRGADRRDVADHEHGRRNDRPGSLRPWPKSRSRGPLADGRRRIGDPFVRAVARLPVNVRTKLLIAFVGTSLLLVAVGLLGQLVLGQSNDRVASVGPLQERAVEYGKIQAEAGYLRGVLAQNAGPDFNVVWPDAAPERSRDVLARSGPVSRSTRPTGSRRARPRIDSGSRRPPRTGTSCGGSRSRPMQLWRLMEQEIIPLYERPYDRGRGDDPRRCCRCARDAELLASDLHQDAASLANGTRERDRGSDRPERELLRELPGPVHRRRVGGARPRAAARVRPVVVGGRADPADRQSPRRDRVGRLLGPRGGRQSRRARRAGRQRQPDERRAAASLHRARGGESAQVGVPGQHVPRAADAAERDHRLLAGVARRDGRPGEREAGGVPR